jgi:enamine deaminase RidA (YjgF/YER057c/UK114 family)
VARGQAWQTVSEEALGQSRGIVKLERGCNACSAIGVGNLPRDITFEIEAVAEVSRGARFRFSRLPYDARRRRRTPGRL